MDLLDKEIYRANAENVQENNKLSSAQSKEVEKIINSKMAELSQERAKDRANLDYFLCKIDPEKPNFDETLKIGAKVVSDNEALKAGFSQAENKASFLYEIGLREKAYQELNKRKEAPAQQALPPPQFSTSPYQGHRGIDGVPWNGLSEAQFVEEAQKFGIQF